MIKVYLALLCKMFFDICLMIAVIYCVVQWMVGMNIGKLFNM